MGIVQKSEVLPLKIFTSSLRTPGKLDGEDGEFTCSFSGFFEEHMGSLSVTMACAEQQSGEVTSGFLHSTIMCSVK